MAIAEIWIWTTQPPFLEKHELFCWLIGINLVSFILDFLCYIFISWGYVYICTMFLAGGNSIGNQSFHGERKKRFYFIYCHWTLFKFGHCIFQFEKWMICIMKYFIPLFQVLMLGFMLFVNHGQSSFYFNRRCRNVVKVISILKERVIGFSKREISKERGKRFLLNIIIEDYYCI